MRIVSFNIRHGLRTEGGVDTSALAAYSAALGADVLGLQEVDAGAGRSGRVDQAAVTADRAGMTAVFGAARRMGWRGAYGNALLVRGALLDVERVALPRLSRHEPRGAVVARALLDEGELSVAVTHLSVDPDESRAQLDAVLAVLSARPLPRVLVGDLNLRVPAIAAAMAGAGLTLADPAEPTFPAGAPRARIDHVAVAGLEVLRVEVPAPAPVSDHRPLVVEVGFP